MIVELPCGYVDAAGDLHREAELAALRGREEELLAAVGRTPAEQVTEVLAACVRRIGAIGPVDAAVARELTVGDRLFLLLKLREATLGPDVALVTSCSWSDCATKIDIDFRIGDVPVRRCAPGGPVYEVALSDEAGGQTVRFRLPNGADQERCAPLLDTNPAAALRLLLDGCLVASGPSRADALSARARAEIEAAMSERAGGPELTMQARCPSCARAVTIPFDVQDVLFGEVGASADLLLRQVHYLAFHYHWAEAEILELPRDRRLQYVELLAEEIERMNDAVG